MSVSLDFEDEESEDLYAPARLNENPFSVDGLPSEAVTILADFIKIWYNIQEKIRLVITRGYRKNFLLFGEYGRGKTHFLKFIYHEIKKLKKRKPVVFYCQLPQSLRFRELYTQLISNNLTEDTILDVFKENIPASIQGPLGNDVKSAIECIVENRNRNIAWRWLRGDSTYSDQRKEIGVGYRIDNNDDYAFEAFLSLLKAFVSSGVGIVFIGIDELEMARIRYSSERRATERLLVYFRRFIDMAPNNIFFMLAATEEFRRVFNQMGPIVSRIPQQDIETIPLIDDLSTMKIFISGYLESSRPPNFIASHGIDSSHDFSVEREDCIIAGYSEEDADKKMEKYGDAVQYSLYPFHIDALEKLRIISGGLPRNIVRGCHFLLEHFVLDEDLQHSFRGIDLDFIESNEEELLSLFVLIR